VVIVNWNGSEDTISCVKSLVYANADFHRIIVVDNGSNENDLRNLGEGVTGNVEIIKNHQNLGFAAANNVGMKRALGQGCTHVLLLNNDTIVTRDFLSQLLDGLDAYPQAGIATPKILYLDRKDTIWAAGGRLVWWFNHFNIGMEQKAVACCGEARVVDFVSGACMLLKREVIEKIGFLPLDYFMGMEDIDYCYHARQFGYLSLYWPKSEIYHKVSASYMRGKLDYLIVYLGVRNSIVFRAKYFSKARLAVYVSVLVVSSLPLYVAHFLLRKRDLKLMGEYIRGLVRGLKEAIEIYDERSQTR